MNKKEYILELIQKGHSDEEIELLVKDKFPEEEIIPFMPAAPAASTNVTPQAYFDRLVAATIKLEAKKLSKANIAHKKGQITIFNVEQVAPSKFADTTLFDKYELPLGAALLGGNTKTLVNGEVISHNHSQEAHSHRVYSGDRKTGDSWGFIWGGNYHPMVMAGIADTGNNQYTDGTKNTNDQNIPLIEKTTPTINATGGTGNKAYGLQIISHIYVAKKDITYAEMGEN